MKRYFLLAVLLALLPACGTDGETTPPADGSIMEQDSTPRTAEPAAVRKEDCASVYAEVIAVNGSHLTVSIGDRILALSVRSEVLTDWKDGAPVVLYYTGRFGDNMQVHYIDKWTENSEVTPSGDEKRDDSDSASPITG